MTSTTIKNIEIKEIIADDAPKFPKYTTQILNLANQNSQATCPRNVGQMSELIQEFKPATPQDESKGIDGFIGGKPISIKPMSYKSKRGLNEEINVDFIFYEKKSSYIKIEYNF